jgi:hypothetical protein
MLENHLRRIARFQRHPTPWWPCHDDMDDFAFESIKNDSTVLHKHGGHHANFKGLR